jgi:predicted nucleic-acid-binding protein
MIGLDTNIFVRLVVADDPAQTARAQRFVETRCTPEAPGFINCIVLAELVWVLARAYDYSRAEIAAAVENLLAGDDRVIEHDKRGA